MPLWEFKCNKCNKVIEVLSKHKPVQCMCGGSITYIPAIVGISFKCSGFYETDYKETK